MKRFISCFSLWLVLLHIQNTSILRSCEASPSPNEPAPRNSSEGENGNGNGDEIRKGMKGTAEIWRNSGIVPQVIGSAPPKILKIKYQNVTLNSLGLKVTKAQTMSAPVKVMYGSVNPRKFYTLSMVDPDAPSELRQINHWLIGNIRGENVSTGEILASYVSPEPSEGSGFHRYIFLLFQQPGKLEFDPDDFPMKSFSIKKFAQLYRLRKPIFGNFFQAQYPSS